MCEPERECECTPFYICFKSNPLNNEILFKRLVGPSNHILYVCDSSTDEWFQLRRIPRKGNGDDIVFVLNADRRVECARKSRGRTQIGRAHLLTPLTLPY